MPAAVYNFTVEQGATWDETFTWKDNQAPPQPINLTGYTAHMQLRPSYGSSTVLLDLTTANSGIILGGAAGTIRVVMTATQTEAFTWVPLSGALVATAVYDLKVTSGGGVVTRLLKGVITLDTEVTVA